ncbi:glycosyltransferase family 2 protein [Xylanibacillus composti]|uniref:Glycosyl transferase family 2 n=1 Tax=Xylanibacillus composti TaxID=1572762 RepID=A0A8J4H814_9BACL|nr:glycosyltransferase [Xylanibacillus composti]MDT9727212.1 glycosyltransferase family 2 protein [Xylanibacillus composti]GIQ71521.1 glycosyl transferase family 2 [Xylanibacillus composti]
MWTFDYEAVTDTLLGALREFLLFYSYTAIYYVIFVTLLLYLIFGFSIRHIASIKRGIRYNRIHKLSGHAPPVSILVPAYNEEVTIIENVRSLLALHYAEYEVIVVNDGSQDHTLQRMIDEFRLELTHPVLSSSIQTGKIRGVYHNPEYPNLYLIDKENGGKADSLNAGINLSHYDLISTIDADSLLEKDALTRIARVYMENPEETVAVGGNVRIVNSCTVEDGIVKDVKFPRKLLPALQHVEYLKAFLGGRIGWSSVNGLIIISGAFGVFQKDKVIAVGGYRGGYPGEDMNIVIKLHRYCLENDIPYRVAFCPDAVCWTQAPESYRILSSQRKRWGRGNLKNMIEEGIHMVMRPKYKIFGLLTLPYNIVFETLNPYFRLGGMLAILGYWMLNMTDWTTVLVFALVNLFSCFTLSLGALYIEETAFGRYPKLSDLNKTILYSFLMFAGYRQIGVWWRLSGHVQFLRNNNSWGTMVRTNFNK